MIGKTVEAETEDARGNRIVVFTDGTGFSLEYGSDLSADDLVRIAQDVQQQAEMRWLWDMEEEWYRDATCEERREWTLRHDEEIQPTEKRRRDDEAMIETGAASTLPVYCATCGETWCPNGKPAKSGPNRSLDAVLRAIFRPDALELELEGGSFLDMLGKDKDSESSLDK